MANANLAYLLDVRQARLRIVRRYLGSEGVDVGPLLGDGDPVAVLTELNAWAKAKFAGWDEQPLASEQVWLASGRHGSEILYSLLMDIALLLAEAIIQRRPGYRWEINRDPTDIRDGMISVNRCVLTIPGRGPGQEPFGLDIEHVAVSRYIRQHESTYRLQNEWRNAVTDAVSGGYG